jgi:hypothetical protein
MADQATSSISTSVFLDEIKSRMNGICDYTPVDADDKWIFAEVAVGNSSADLVATLDYLGTSTPTVVGDDDVEWIAIKNISGTATDGIAVRIDAQAAAHNSAGNMYIGAGEMLVMKCRLTPIGSIHAISVTLTGASGGPSGTHSGTVACHVAAILADGGS